MYNERVSYINFEHVLRAGLGRAVLYLRQHDPAPHRQTILNACLHNVALDRQLEGTRVEYLLDILDATHEVEFYQTQVLNALEKLTEVTDEYDIDLLYALAMTFAQRGDVQARTAIYRKFDTMPGLGGFTGANAIIDLDGLNGFLYAAKRLREELLTHGDEFVVGENIYFLDEPFAKVLKARTWKVQVKQLYGQEPHVGWYIRGIVAETETPTTVAGPKPFDLASFPYEGIKSLIDHSNPKNSERWRLWSWGKQASTDDILRAATDLLAETDPQQLLLYVDIFRKRAFPLEPIKLVELAKNGHDPLMLRGPGANQTDHLALWAINALENVAHPDVRACALDSIRTGYLVARMVGLLKSNFVDGDWAIIQKLTDRDSDPDEYHTLGFNVWELFDRHPVQAAVGSLLNLYKKGLCSLCRCRAVERLHALGAIPAWMREECLYDANLELREAAKIGFKSFEADELN